MSSLIIPNGGSGTATVTEDGVTRVLAEGRFSPDDARILRDFQKLLERYQLGYRLGCKVCLAEGLDSEMSGGISANKIAFACKHRMLSFVGQTL
jgi:hypothetical protein